MTPPRFAEILQKIVARRRERMEAIRAHPDATAEIFPPAESEPQGWGRGSSRGVTPTPRSRSDPRGGKGTPPPANLFLASLAADRGKAVIAEVKMGSPRIGSLVDRIDPEAQARLYADQGAAALSVVVEPDFFHGSYGLLARCREASGLPAIAKDFVVDPLQIRWAADAGADAILLIAALYGSGELRRYAAVARRAGLVPLVEIHHEEDLELLAAGRAPGDTDWELVGINNRDLRTFEVDLERSRRLAPRLPEGALKVAESGIATGDDVARLREAGFDAFLVGESLLLADDPAAKLRELVA